MNINSYHSDREFNLTEPFNLSAGEIKFGMELEVEFEQGQNIQSDYDNDIISYDDYVESTNDYMEDILPEFDKFSKKDITLEEDCSLNCTSFELITRPIVYNGIGFPNFFNTLLTTVEELNEKWDCCHNNNGMHIHIDRKSFINDKALYMFMYLFNSKKLRGDIVTFAGRETYFAKYMEQNCTDSDVNNFENEINDGAFNLNLLDEMFGDKYSATHYTDYGTLEIRVFRVWYNKESIKRVIQTLYNMIMYCNSHQDWNTADDLDMITFEEFQNITPIRTILYTVTGEQAKIIEINDNGYIVEFDNGNKVTVNSNLTIKGMEEYGRVFYANKVKGVEVKYMKSIKEIVKDLKLERTLFPDENRKVVYVFYDRKHKVFKERNYLQTNYLGGGFYIDNDYTNGEFCEELMSNGVTWKEFQEYMLNA